MTCWNRGTCTEPTSMTCNKLCVIARQLQSKRHNTALTRLGDHWRCPSSFHTTPTAIHSWVHNFREKLKLKLSDQSDVCLFVCLFHIGPCRIRWNKHVYTVLYCISKQSRAEQLYRGGSERWIYIHDLPLCYLFLLWKCLSYTMWHHWTVCVSDFLYLAKLKLLSDLYQWWY